MGVPPAASHRGGARHRPARVGGGDQRAERLLRNRGGRPMTARTGDVVAVSSLTHHRSGANPADALRRAYVTQFSPEPIPNPAAGRPKTFARKVTGREGPDPDQGRLTRPCRWNGRKCAPEGDVGVKRRRQSVSTVQTSQPGRRFEKKLRPRPPRTLLRRPLFRFDLTKLVEQLCRCGSLAPRGADAAPEFEIVLDRRPGGKPFTTLSRLVPHARASSRSRLWVASDRRIVITHIRSFLGWDCHTDREDHPRYRRSNGGGAVHRARDRVRSR